jgi:hypothetical protein
MMGEIVTDQITMAQDGAFTIFYTSLNLPPGLLYTRAAFLAFGFE